MRLGFGWPAASPQRSDRGPRFDEAIARATAAIQAPFCERLLGSYVAELIHNPTVGWAEDRSATMAECVEVIPAKILLYTTYCFTRRR